MKKNWVSANVDEPSSYIYKKGVDVAILGEIHRYAIWVGEERHINGQRQHVYNTGNVMIIQAKFAGK